MTPTPEQAAAAVFASLDYGPHAVVKNWQWHEGLADYCACCEQYWWPCPPAKDIRIDALITALAAVQAERDELLARLGVAEQRVEVADHLIRFRQ